MLLKQRFLDSKAKRQAKKSEKKTCDSLMLIQPTKVGGKRSASEDGECGSDGGFSDGGPAPKSGGPPSSQEQLTKFSVEIVHEFTTSTNKSQISTNVTVKTAVNGNGGGGPVKSETNKSEPPAPQEPTSGFVDLEQCAAALEKDADGGNSFPGISDLIGDDTSDAIITSDAFNDLISEISDINPEFMRDFEFDAGEGKAEPKREEPPPPAPCREQQQPKGGMPLSPAAHTLKQMARHHQNKMATFSRPYEYRFDGELLNGGQMKTEGLVPCAAAAAGGSGSFKQRAGKPQAAQHQFSHSQGQSSFTPRHPTLQMSQSQQLHLSQAHQIQVSMSQNMNAEIKGGIMSVGSQQGMYVTSDGTFCGGSPSSNPNQQQQQQQQQQKQQQQQQQQQHLQQQHQAANQQGPSPFGQLRPRQLSNLIRQPNQPLKVEVNAGNCADESRGNEYKPQGQPTLLHRPTLLTHRFPHLIPSHHPMQPSNVMRTQSPMYSSNPQARNGNFHRPRIPMPEEWKPNLGQNRLPNFIQAQGVTFSTNDTRLSAGQVQQQMSRLAQQSLNIHHSNPQMHMGLQMNQSLAGPGGVPFNTASMRPTMQQMSPFSTPNFSTANNIFTSSYCQPNQIFLQNPNLQHEAAPNLPPDLNLDFLEQLPAGDGNQFSDSELLSSFNLQDIL